MEVVLAKSAGFCFGVERAVNMVTEAAQKEGTDIYTYGPIVHNEQVVDELKQKGVCVISSMDEIKSIKKGTIAIRAHGVGPDVYGAIRQAGLNIIDATCPFVKKIHETVEKAASAGKNVIIAGDASHPEVVGILGWSKGKGVVVSSQEELDSLNDDLLNDAILVAQTTFHAKKFKSMVENLKKKEYNIEVANTICNATDERQREAELLADRSDVMIVIGGRSSSNTRKLYDICKARCNDTYFIQSLEDFYLLSDRQINTVGITAGASTPRKIIKEVQNYVRNEF